MMLQLIDILTKTDIKKIKYKKCIVTNCKDLENK